MLSHRSSGAAAAAAAVPNPKAATAAGLEPQLKHTTLSEGQGSQPCPTIHESGVQTGNGAQENGQRGSVVADGAGDRQQPQQQFHSLGGRCVCVHLCVFVRACLCERM